MTKNERLDMMKALIPDLNESDEVLEMILESAKDFILRRRFPFALKEMPIDVEPEYEVLQVRIAVEMYSKLGIEGETQHSEAGITRTYWGCIQTIG